MKRKNCSRNWRGIILLVIVFVLLSVQPVVAQNDPPTFWIDDVSLVDETSVTVTVEYNKGGSELGGANVVGFALKYSEGLTLANGWFGLPSPWEGYCHPYEDQSIIYCQASIYYEAGGVYKIIPSAELFYLEFAISESSSLTFEDYSFMTPAGDFIDGEAFGAEISLELTPPEPTPTPVPTEPNPYPDPEEPVPTEPNPYPEPQMESGPSSIGLEEFSAKSGFGWVLGGEIALGILVLIITIKIVGRKK